MVICSSDAGRLLLLLHHFSFHFLRVFTPKNMFVDFEMPIRMLWLLPFVGTLLSASALPNNKPRASVYPVLGVRGLGVDTTQPRLEIRELERNRDQFNVYLLGLQRLQNISQDDSLSYYQIAGMSIVSGERPSLRPDIEAYLLMQVYMADLSYPGTV
jgi:hypothetical protein